jgi:ATP-dependent helicase/nuclease subunit A
MTPTAEQLAIIGARDPDILVSAGAGSGKTRVLVDRYLLLLGECEVTQLAAITFTEAAATEMRQRVREALERGGTDTERHRAAFDEAVIGTIHALCLRILREHPVEAGIDPDVRILGEDEAMFELAEACRDAIDAAAETSEEMAAAIFALGDWGIDSALPEMVGDRWDVREAFAQFPGETAGEWMEYAKSKVEEAGAKHAARVRREIEGRIRLLVTARGAPTIAAYRPQLEAALNATGVEFLAHLRSTRGGAAEDRSVFHDIHVHRDMSSEERDILEELRKEAGRALRYWPEWTEYDQPAIQAAFHLKQIWEFACGMYAQRKAALRALDYLDMEELAVRLLEDHPEIARRYQERFREVMVDEFQDTNALQVKLIGLLTNRRGAGERSRMFAVGDACQAIYRFRGGDVEQFNELRAGLRGDALPLSRSFRTHQALVEQTNELFSRVLDGRSGERYEAKFARMQGRDGEPPPGPHLTILRVAKAATAPDNESAQKLQLRVEADLVARTIGELVESKRMVWAREEGRYRPAQYRDIAILLRRFTNVHTFEQALEWRGVPYRTLQGAGFFGRQEVLDLANLLAWLAEPADQVALMGVLRSPMFLIDDATLAALRRANRYDFLRGLAEPPAGVGDEAAGRCRRAADILAKLADRARTAPVDAILQAALEETAVEATWFALEGGDQAVANIRKLVDLARTLAGRSLDEVVEYIFERREEYLREGQAVLDEADAVQIMTVHGAKGLEFPVVFVPEAQATAVRDNDAVRWHRAVGVALNLEREAEESSRRRTGFHMALRNLDYQEEEAEYRRLFYVACTRAADYLYISGSVATGDSWLQMALDVFEPLGRESVDIPEAVPASLAEVRRARRPGPRVPPEREETPAEAPLLERPRVIPVRTSTPVTALREHEPQARWGHGDGLGVLRGKAAHRAIEMRYGLRIEPDVLALCRELREWAVPEHALATVVSDVEDFLRRFDESGLAGMLRSGLVRPYFELPFAYDWDGVPVHGVIDLAYEQEGRWQIVDFKTDRVDGRPLEQAARPYLPQLGLYGLALQKATGSEPGLALAFLRTGAVFEVSWSSVRPALEAARKRVDAGAALDLSLDALPEELPE